jgi:hypothetical protein
LELNLIQLKVTELAATSLVDIGSPVDTLQHSTQIPYSSVTEARIEAKSKKKRR